jgi:hypothetical protein
MNKKIKIIPYTLEKELAGIPPTPAIKHLPEWYKKLSPYTDGAKKLKYPMGHGSHNTGLKRCVPFLDAMTAGYMFVLDDDIYVEQLEDGPSIRWKSPVSMVTMHSPNQFEGLSIPKGYHNIVWKWHNEYILETPPGYSMLFTHPINRFDLPFRTITGLVDTDLYGNGVQFPFFLEEGFEGIIESGTPLCQMIPIKKDSWETSLEKYDEHDYYKKSRKFARTFEGSYKKNFWNKKSYS